MVKGGGRDGRREEAEESGRKQEEGGDREGHQEGKDDNVVPAEKR